jgi:hypothetical protein
MRKRRVSAQNESAAFGGSCGLLLILAPVMLDLMEGVFELAGFKGIELGFRHANFTDQDLEVGRLGVALDEGGKSELLEWHRIPPRASIAKINVQPEILGGCGKRIVKNPLRLDLK